MAHRFHVAVFADSRNGFHRAALQGIGRFLQQRGDWSVYAPDLAMTGGPELAGWGLDGALMLESRTPKPTGVPVVSMRSEDVEAPLVIPDWEAVARLAAEHLAERGLRQFAFFGAAAPYTEVRRSAFARAVEARGGAYQQCLLSSADRKSWPTMMQRIGDWLTGLTKPVGVLVANDEFGR